jgi:hypothetical protein
VRKAKSCRDGKKSDRLRMSPSLGNPYMRSGAANGLMVLAPSCSALLGSRSPIARARSASPSRAQIGPAAKLCWSDRHKPRRVVRELPHHRRIDVQVLRHEFRRRVRQPVRERDLLIFGSLEHRQDLCVGRPGAARPARRPRAARQRQLSRTAAGGQNVVPLKRRKQLGVIPLFRSGR